MQVMARFGGAKMYILYTKLRLFILHLYLLYTAWTLIHAEDSLLIYSVKLCFAMVQ